MFLSHLLLVVKIGKFIYNNDNNKERERTMIRCEHCQSLIDTIEVNCPYCGKPVKNKPVQRTYSNSIHTEDEHSIGYGLLGFFFPYIGFFLYFIWKNELPKRAKSVGIGVATVIFTSMAFVVIAVFILIMAALFS